MKVRSILLSLALAASFTACKQTTEEKTDASTPHIQTDPVTEADPKVEADGSLQTLEGTFVGIEQGDYMHAIVKDNAGTEHSYYMANDFPGERIGELEEGLWDGKKVKVQWRKTVRDIPEAGGNTVIEEIVAIEAL